MVNLKEVLNLIQKYFLRFTDNLSNFFLKLTFTTLQIFLKYYILNKLGKLKKKQFKNLKN